MSSVPEDDIQTEVQRVDENVNGLFELVSGLRDRIERLEEENAELRAEIQSIKQWEADDGS